MANKVLRKYQKNSLRLCLGIVLCCLLLIILFSGIRFEDKKLKQFTVTLTIVMLTRYILWEHVEFLLLAFVTNKIQPKLKKEGSELSLAAKEESHKGFYFSPLSYLEMRLATSKFEVNITARHKDENLNMEYLLLSKELWMFAKYFILILALVVYSRSEYRYFNTRTIKSFLIQDRSNQFGFRRMVTINHLYDILNDTFVRPLIEGVDYRGDRLQESGWMDYEIAKLLGVVRVKQIRFAAKSGGMLKLHYNGKKFYPGWHSMDRNLYYIGKYWRTYYPWMPKTAPGILNWLVTFSQFDSLYSYNSSSEDYVVMLARDEVNNCKILNFLKKKNWLNSETAAVFIDFVLYSVDANIFTIISIFVEQTPFGTVAWKLDLQSVVLLTSLDQLNFGWWLLLLVYIFQLIEFCKAICIKYWYASNFFHSVWNCVDCVIVLLNVAVFTLLSLRQDYVRHAIASIETASKLKYVNFRAGTFFDYLASLMMGLLIALCTIRLWKLLQFCYVFKLFTRTWFIAAADILATIAGICLFLCAFGFATQLVNGNNAAIFSTYLKSLSSIMRFSFGFDEHTDPKDLSYGGQVFGFILYLILMFVVAIFLINMFIALICHHFAAARTERNNQSTDQISYGEFLWLEYGSSLAKFCSNIPAHRERHPKVKKSIQAKLNQLDENHIQGSTGRRPESIMSDALYAADALKADRMQKIIEVLKLQMDIMNRKITLHALELDTDDEEDD